MTELERKALLGDTEAQKQCTEQGIILPCPLCKGAVKYYFAEKHEDVGKGAVVVIPAMSYVKCKCGYSVQGVGEKTAIKIHNSRPSPPVGKCEDCRYFRKSVCKKAAPHYITRVYKSFYCKGFKPKEADDTL